MAKIPKVVQEYFDQVFAPHGVREDLGNDWLGQMVTAMDDVSTLEVASRLLREHEGVSYSVPNWGALKNDRLRPALDAGDMTRNDVKQMLQEMEEHGKVHVLLYRPAASANIPALLRPPRVSRALVNLGISGVLDSDPQPTNPVNMRVTHVRFEEDGALIVKALETKESFRQIQSFKLPGGREVRLAQRNRVRRVKLARLHNNGLLEVRLGSARFEPGEKNDHRYTEEAQAFLQMIAKLIPPAGFEPAPLDVFKANLWNRSRKGKEDGILVLAQHMASDQGNLMALRAGSRAADASGDEALRAASRAFLQRQGSSMSQAKILWRGQTEPALPQMHLTVRVTDEAHEFFTTRATCKADYESVLSDIRRLGRL